MDGSSDAFRDVMRRFPTGVTVVGAAYEGLKRGMTVNAFTSVSLDPHMVVICISKDSGCHGLIENSGTFSVSVLSEDQSELSGKFANHEEIEVHQFLGVDHHSGSLGNPLVDGAIAELECTVADRLPAGDHTLFVGKVASARLISGKGPLIFYQSRYVKVGKSVED